MSDCDKYIQPLGKCRDIARVGGKAVNLARLVDAGFDVPDGFVVTTDAFRTAATESRLQMPEELADAIGAAYQEMGSPKVAVRSSATAEDMAQASMAGQYETFLDVEGQDALLDAVVGCWKSIGAGRAQSYLSEQSIDAAAVEMAVVVQRLIPADVAGVLFTVNPRTANESEMLIEASWGLGEAVVSGIVQPDTVTVDSATGAVRERVISDKRVWVEPVSRKQRELPESKRKAPCLGGKTIAQLRRLGKRIKEYFGSDQDVEWAIIENHLYVLQSRSITTLEDVKLYEQCLFRTRRQLKICISEGRGPWVRHNISETLPHPTPLTWSVVKEFMSGAGGFGSMYKQVGFEPSEAACRDGFLDLIGGRIYMDLSRTVEMFFENFPFSYDLALIRSNPDAAQGRPTVPAGSLRARYHTGRRIAEINARLELLSRDCDSTLRQQVFPEFMRWVCQERQRGLSQLSNEELLNIWRQRKSRVLDDFAPQALMPSLICAMAVDKLRTFLSEHFWDQKPAELLNVLSVGAEPDSTTRANQGLYEIANSGKAVDDWLSEYGHRGPQEFDLGSGRWREQPDEVLRNAQFLGKGRAPADMFAGQLAEAESCIERLKQGLPHWHHGEFDNHLRLVRRYLPFREDVKHYLMAGYDLLRDLAREMGRRLEIGDSVFYLTFGELCDSVASGCAPRQLLVQRHTEHKVQGKLSLGNIITREEIETLGKPPELVFGKTLAAFALSSGSGTGPARIVLSPEEAGDFGNGCVLVCPSTDPGWTPLFSRASALIMECGGTLSHGAVVAREMGIPAVVLAGATSILSDGEKITVDGNNGLVVREGASGEVAAAGPLDTRIEEELMPPAVGPRERSCARLRNIFLFVWAVYLVAVFVLPES